jgi:phage tail sheath protein FI
MANFRAPGIRITEKDVSEVIVPSGSSVGALVGPAYQGPTNQRILNTTNKEFFQTFGTPTSGATSEFGYYAADEFLQQSGFMWFVRTTTSADTVGTIEYTGTTSATPALFSEGDTASVLATAGFEDGNKLDNYYPMETSADPAGGITIGANSCGEHSKNIGISIVTSASSTTTSGVGFDYGYNWEGKFPTDWEYYRINVYTKLDKTSDIEAGWVTGTSAISAVVPEESYIVSNSELAKDFEGNSLYVKDVINGVSPLIYAVPGTDVTFLNNDWAAEGISSLVEGDSSIDMSSVVDGWDLFANRDAVSPDILIAPYDSTDTNTQAKNALIAAASTAATRRDCMAVVNVGSKTDSATNIAANKGAVSAYNSSYVACYGGWDLIFDSFSGKNLYIPKSIFGAAGFAKNDSLANPWNAPAGLTRGVLTNSLGQLKIFNESEIGYMYNSNVNTSKRVRGSGDVMWGQKTGQTKTTATDRINVRRLLNYIEKSIEPGLLAYMFEQNTEKLRSRVKNNLDSFLRTVQAGEGLTTFDVVVDESNNTAQVIDNNELAIDIYVQPTKTIEFINVQVIITRTGVSFAEV